MRYARLADVVDNLNRCRVAGDGGYYQHMDAYKTVRLLIIDGSKTALVVTRSAIDLFGIMEASGARAAVLAFRLIVGTIPITTHLFPQGVIA